MVQNKNHSNKNKIILTSLAVIFIGTLAFVLFVKNNDQKSDSTINGDSTTKQLPAAESPSIDYSPSEPSANDETNKQKENADKQQPVVDTGLSTAITFANQNTATEVTVRILVTGTTTGTCKIVFYNEKGTTVEKTAPVVLKGGNYSCDGFTVATSELSAGTWTVKSTVEVNNTTSEPSEASVIVS